MRYSTHKKGQEVSKHFPNCPANKLYPKSVHSAEADTSMSRIKKSQSSLLRRRHTGQGAVCASRSTFKGTKKMQWRILNLQQIIITKHSHYNCPFRLSPSCSRKRGLFGHDVHKSHEAWQTMELYRARISEVHQTPPSHGKPIWACRDCLGLPRSKKNEAKRWCFGRAIYFTSLALT